MRHRTLIVATLEGGTSGKGQSLDMFGVRLQCPRDQLFRFALQTLVHGHSEGVGVVGQQISIPRNQFHQARICIGRITEPAQRIV